MAQPPIKGRLLQLLQEGGPQWDYELAEKITREYSEVGGRYWYDTIRLSLADLYSSGLITETEEALDASKSYGAEKILFKFDVTDFGRRRMRETGLLVGTGSKEGR